jgi:hypothetical protein
MKYYINKEFEILFISFLRSAELLIAWMGKENGFVNKLIKYKDELQKVLSTVIDSKVDIDDEAYEIRKFEMDKSKF